MCLWTVQTAGFETFQNKARSRIVQAKGLGQIEQIGISLNVSIKSGPVRTVRTSARLAGRTKGTPLYRIHFKEKPIRHQATIENGTDEKLVGVLL